MSISGICHYLLLNYIFKLHVHIKVMKRIMVMTDASYFICLFFIIKDAIA